MRIHIIVHESYESPAAIAWWAGDRKHKVTYSNVFLGDPLPNPDELDFLVIMGGPQSPISTLSEYPHFNSEAEMSLIREAIEEEKLVLGVCLGAQLMAQALSASFEHSPEREIGVFPITLTEAGKQDPLLEHFPERMMVGHWHGDMPGLPEGSAVLAKSEGCPRQIVRFNERAYGFQCHMEFTKEAVLALIAKNTSEFDQESLPPYVQSPEDIASYDYDLMNQMLFRFLDQFCLLAKNRSIVH